MLKTLEGTRFRDSPIVAVAARPGGAEVRRSDDYGGGNDKTVN